MATPLPTVPDAAVRIGVSARVMRNEVLGPDGPATVFVGRRMMIDADDLAAWWERRRRASATKASPQLRATGKRYIQRPTGRWRRVGMTPAQRLAELPNDQRREVLTGLTADDLKALEYSWEFWARLDQLAPPGNWRTWLLLGGRGSGKTRSASEWVRGQMESGRRRQLGIIAPTADAMRRIRIEGPSGLLATAPPWARPEFEPSTRRVVYPNGGIVHLFSSEEPDRLRGPNLDGLWIDELTSMANGPALGTWRRWPCAFLVQWAMRRWLW